MSNRMKRMLLWSGMLGAFAAAGAQAATVPFTESFGSSVSGWENSVNLPLAYTATGGSDGGGFASGTFNFNGFVPGFGGSGPIVLRASAADGASGGAFVGNWLTRVLGETLFLMSVVSIVPALMTSLWPVAAVAFVASWGLTAASFVVQDNYRHIMMHVPLLFLVHALAMAGVGNALRRPRSPGPLEPPPP